MPSTSCLPEVGKRRYNAVMAVDVFALQAWKLWPRLWPRIRARIVEKRMRNNCPFT